LANPYLQMRLNLTRHAITALVLSVRSSAEILFLVFAPAIVGLIAFVALPPLYASSRPFPEAALLVLGHTVLTVAPLWLLRIRLLPPDVIAWLHSLPVPLALQIRTDLAVSAVLMLPLSGAYVASSLVWSYNAPAWLRPWPATAAMLSSVAMTWTLAAAIMTLRSRWRPRPLRRTAQRPVSEMKYTCAPPRIKAIFWYRRLFWLAFLRNENRLARQQFLLLAAACVSAIVWFHPLFPAMRGLCDLITSGLIIIMTDRADKAVRDQITCLRRITASWPITIHRVEWLARALSALPVLSVSGLLIAQARFMGTVREVPGIFYLAVLASSAALLIAVPTFTPRARVGWIVLSIFLLTAIGSEGFK
jgi:hypothetical protein